MVVVGRLVKVVFVQSQTGLARGGAVKRQERRERGYVSQGTVGFRGRGLAAGL